jgi:nitrous oxide reductase accessory protein NosL
MRRLTILTVAILLLVVGCRRNRPPLVVSGTTTCSVCGAVINDLSVASAARSKTTHEEKAFDGVHCLLRAVPEGDDWQVWFHENEGKGWIDAKKASFVLERRHRVINDVRAFSSMSHAKGFGEKFERVGNSWNEYADSYGGMRYAVENFGDHGPGGM